MRDVMDMKKHVVIQIVIATAIVALAIIMIIDLLPLVENVIQDAGNETAMVSYIDSYGAKGIPILMGMQALQVIVAFIPSAAIQVLTGLCYGAYWGTLINLGGLILGNIIVFVAVRQMKGLFVPLFHKIGHSSEHKSPGEERKHKKLISKKLISKEQIEKIKRPELVAFFFFLIPGVPNGIVPYVFAETKISLKKYIAAVAIGSIPSTFICTFLGDSVSNGNYTSAIIIACVVAVMVLGVIIFRKKLLAFITREREIVK